MLPQNLKNLTLTHAYVGHHMAMQRNAELSRNDRLIVLPEYYQQEAGYIIALQYRTDIIATFHIMGHTRLHIPYSRIQGHIWYHERMQKLAQDNGCTYLVENHFMYIVDMNGKKTVLFDGLTMNNGEVKIPS